MTTKALAQQRNSCTQAACNKIEKLLLENKWSRFI